MNEYITTQGQTWDMIAKEVYGDESYTSFLMENNPKALDYFVFPRGVILVIPEKPEEQEVMPDWRS
ncbi:MAG: tail protein X [Lachnospiraceae bacterium]|nr:tail protein X [Lachnospiraceae bacterium]